MPVHAAEVTVRSLSFSPSLSLSRSLALSQGLVVCPSVCLITSDLRRP